jgi:hypothetical protein
MKKKYQAAFFSIVLAGILLTGCTGKKALWGGPDTGYILTYRLASDQMLNYHSSMEQNTSMEIMGNSMNTENRSTMNYTITGKGSDNADNLLLEIKVDSMTVINTGPQGSQTLDTKSLTSKSFGLSVSSLGKEGDYTGTDSLYLDLTAMGGGRQTIDTFFRNPFPDLPERPVKVGEKWKSDDSRTENQGGMEIGIKSHSVSTLTGFETVNGLDCAKILVETTGTLDGAGQQMGMDLTFEGDTESTTTWYFAYKKGVVIKASSEIFMEATIAASGAQNMTIPMTQEANSELHLIQ